MTRGGFRESLSISAYSFGYDSGGLVMSKVLVLPDTKNFRAFARGHDDGMVLAESLSLSVNAVFDSARPAYDEGGEARVLVPELQISEHLLQLAHISYRASSFRSSGEF